MPAILLLVFIITPLSNGSVSQVSQNMQNAQGWLAVGSWGAGILTFIFVKFFLWDILNLKVANAKTDSFLTYNLIHHKVK
jgi:hypothetical protein